jgi:hypothetical protein
MVKTTTILTIVSYNLRTFTVQATAVTKEKSFIQLFLAFLLIIYKYRFEFWFLSYRLARFRLGHRKDSDPGTFAYHSFVSYASANEGWVLNELMENLENPNHDQEPIL